MGRQARRILAGPLSRAYMSLRIRELEETLQIGAVGEVRSAGDGPHGALLDPCHELAGPGDAKGVQGGSLVFRGVPVHLGMA